MQKKMIEERNFKNKIITTLANNFIGKIIFGLLSLKKKLRYLSKITKILWPRVQDKYEYL